MHPEQTSENFQIGPTKPALIAKQMYCYVQPDMNCMYSYYLSLQNPKKHLVIDLKLVCATKHTINDLAQASTV